MEQNVSEIKKKISKRIETNHVERYFAYIEIDLKCIPIQLIASIWVKALQREIIKKCSGEFDSYSLSYEIQCILPLQDQSNILIEEFFAL